MAEFHRLKQRTYFSFWIFSHYPPALFVSGTIPKSLSIMSAAKVPVQSSLLHYSLLNSGTKVEVGIR